MRLNGFNKFWMRFLHQKGCNLTVAISVPLSRMTPVHPFTSHFWDGGKLFGPGDASSKYATMPTTKITAAAKISHIFESINSP